MAGRTKAKQGVDVKYLGARGSRRGAGSRGDSRTVKNKERTAQMYEAVENGRRVWKVDSSHIPVSVQRNSFAKLHPKPSEQVWVEYFDDAGALIRVPLVDNLYREVVDVMGRRLADAIYDAGPKVGSLDGETERDIFDVLDAAWPKLNSLQHWLVRLGFKSWALRVHLAHAWHMIWVHHKWPDRIDYAADATESGSPRRGRSRSWKDSI